MRSCPKCNETYTDETLVFCRVDGALLQVNNPAESSDTQILPTALSGDELPTQILENETARATEYSSTFEEPVKIQTKKLKPISDSSSHRHIVIIAATVLILTAFGAGFWFIKDRPLPLNSAPVESIAVMPFVNESGNPEMEYLSDGMTETLISRLSQLPNLSVKARSSVFRYKGKETDAQTIGKELNVQAVLTGRVVQRGEQLTLYLELVDARTGNQLWGEQYNSKQADLLRLQTEIARDVSGKLRTRLSGADERHLTKNYTENAEAYQLYLRGRFHWNKRTVKDIRKSIEYFQQAVALDPNYALAYTGLADAYTVLPTYGGAAPHEAIPKAREAALKALSLDDQLAEAHISIALVLNYYDYDFAGAEREFRRAIELNPNSAAAHVFYSNLLMHLGRFEESYPEIRRALEIEPLSPLINRFYGLTLLYDRKYEESVTQLKKTLELDAGFVPAYETLTNVYRLQGKHAESVETSARAEEILGNHAGAALIRDIYAKGGWQKYLRALTDPSVRNRINNERPLRYFVATYYAELGEKDRAFAELNKAYEEREFFMILLKVDPRLDPLRDDPRFEDLMRKVGFPP